MSDDFIKNLKTLLASGRGDGKRIREIVDSMRENNPVYMSDYKYVQNLASEEPVQERAEDGAVSKNLKLGDPIQILRIRLAEGKITIGEFRELKKAISEI